MTNQDLLARSLKTVWHPCTQMKAHETLPLLPIARGEGVWLYDHDGRRYLDAVSSWWVNLFGHANPRINAALRDQLDRLEHVMLAGFTHEPVVQLSERLAALTANALGHCFYASDGASAVEIALKMSQHYWLNSGKPGKNRHVHLAGSYHGETVGALSVTDVAIFRTAYAPLLRDNPVLPSPDWRLAAPEESAAAHARRCAAELDNYLAEHHDEIAALIVEPLVQCAAGMAMHDPEYLRLARESCTRHRVHLICDEIAVGCGRTGTFFASEQAAIWPDFLCLSKGITGGYLPLSLVMTTDAVYQAFYADEIGRAFLHSHSYTGNPLACRAALATLDIFRDDDVLVANRQRAARLTELAADLRTHPKVSNFRQQGMIWAFEVQTDDPRFARRAFAQALQQGLLLRPIGNTVYFMPPYVIDEDAMRLLVNGTQQAIDATLAELQA
ncbi:Adenosylmethionine-8-amino-7-oxononanoate aminotransferase [Sterolibacterium denitrificans]|uniref:Adenosylmethionine-8-amino-7-oxononanoate aminotransferase n=1 Tax=Sterolibacterium denitrificans TaxID=157592 RepID=A0A7Z7MVG9_9PROT|nr:adenosylmethionine--8-amino-7-oxononanoate transaminase [Sterolibacterium denitrificans]SMB27459.1 Adenosylmethionine-8-amino-7-oxononanoate aminotransferase [Sterolibacterium denitrificans]